MNTVRKILVPIDFSDSSITAVKYASEMTRQDRKIEFFLIHVQDGNSKNGKKELDELKEKFFDSRKVPCQAIIKQGELVETLIATNEELSIDLIIFGTAGSVDETINSKTAQLLRKADCSVLIIPASTEGFSLNNIALAVDHKDLDDASKLSVFHDLAKWYNAKVHLVTVDRKDKDNIKLGKAEQTLEYYLESLDYQHAVPKNKDIEKGIEQYIKEQNIDMLAIMPKNHAKSTEPSDGRLTRLLAAHSSVPLLVID